MGPGGGGDPGGEEAAEERAPTVPATAETRALADALHIN